MITATIRVGFSGTNYPLAQIWKNNVAVASQAGGLPNDAPYVVLPVTYVGSFAVGDLIRIYGYQVWNGNATRTNDDANLTIVEIK